MKLVSRLSYALALLVLACATTGSKLPMGSRPSLSYQQYGQAADGAPVPDEQQAATLERQRQGMAEGDRGKTDLSLRLGELRAELWRRSPKDGTLLEAVKDLDQAAKDRAFDHRDEALFQLGRLLRDAKKEAHAREQLHRLIMEHPTSRRVPAAYLFFGEYLFDGGDFKHAGEFYERVTTFEDPTVHAFALYKEGWCWIHIGDMDKASAFFDDALDATRVGRGGNARQSALLAEAAQRDLNLLKGR
jgi:tetratricopeptide (TPR) repeat protein